MHAEIATNLNSSLSISLQAQIYVSSKEKIHIKLNLS